MTLRLVETFQSASFADTTVSYLAAFLFGTLIGAERQYRQRTAGLRTNALVAIGASAFVDLGRRLGGDVESIRVIAYVVSGIGFLGAGVIMKEGTNVRGLNTAATLWCSAAVGAIAGSDLLAEAALLTACVLGANTVLRPLVEAINRIPVAGRVLEASYTVTIVGDGHPGVLADMLEERLASAKMPVAEVTTREQGNGKVEVDALLMLTNADSDELDRFVEALGSDADVLYATWRSATRD